MLKKDAEKFSSSEQQRSENIEAMRKAIKAVPDYKTGKDLYKVAVAIDGLKPEEFEKISGNNYANTTWG